MTGRLTRRPGGAARLRALLDSGQFPTFAEFVDFIGLPQVHQAEQRYAVKPAGTGSETGGMDGSDV